MNNFTSWVRAFEGDHFGIPDEITPTQRALLLDFAHIWEGFARQARLGHGWEIFLVLLRWLATDTWCFDCEHDDGGFAQLWMISQWAREYYPVSFRYPLRRLIVILTRYCHDC